MYDIVGFGEVLIRLSTQNFNRLEQATALDIRVGGAELNCVVTAQRLGMKCGYVTRLAKNPLGRMAFNKIREQGIDASQVLWSDSDRQGITFLEFGAMPRPSATFYDRANSAISKIQPGMVDWDKIFAETKAFHCTGITPALSPNCLAATTEALKKAKDKGVQVSFDLNYRAKLWTGEQANAGLSPLMKYVDILVTTEEDVFRVFQLKGTDWNDVARKLADKFGFKIVCITLREDITVWRNNWTAIALKDGKIYEDRKYDIEVVDRVGAGDNFAGGFLYAYMTKDGDVQTALKYGNACAVLKHSNAGDYAFYTKEEVETLVAGKGSLRIAR
jgi:2-dehydro-3-deoxygluconokinase